VDWLESDYVKNRAGTANGGLMKDNGGYGWAEGALSRQTLWGPFNITFEVGQDIAQAHLLGVSLLNGHVGTWKEGEADEGWTADTFNNDFSDNGGLVARTCATCSYTTLVYKRLTAPPNGMNWYGLFTSGGWGGAGNYQGTDFKLYTSTSLTEGTLVTSQAALDSLSEAGTKTWKMPYASAGGAGDPSVDHGATFFVDCFLADYGGNSIYIYGSKGLPDYTGFTYDGVHDTTMTAGTKMYVARYDNGTVVFGSTNSAEGQPQRFGGCNDYAAILGPMKVDTAVYKKGDAWDAVTIDECQSLLGE
jgi:hypothetical protein